MFTFCLGTASPGIVVCDPDANFQNTVRVFIFSILSSCFLYSSSCPSSFPYVLASFLCACSYLPWHTTVFPYLSVGSIWPWQLMGRKTQTTYWCQRSNKKLWGQLLNVQLKQDLPWPWTELWYEGGVCVFAVINRPCCVMSGSHVSFIDVLLFG